MQAGYLAVVHMLLMVGFQTVVLQGQGLVYHEAEPLYCVTAIQPLLGLVLVGIASRDNSKHRFCVLASQMHA